VIKIFADVHWAVFASARSSQHLESYGRERHRVKLKVKDSQNAKSTIYRKYFWENWKYFYFVLWVFWRVGNTSTSYRKHFLLFGNTTTFHHTNVSPWSYPCLYYHVTFAKSVLQVPQKEFLSAKRRYLRCWSGGVGGASGGVTRSLPIKSRVKGNKRKSAIPGARTHSEYIRFGAQGTGGEPRWWEISGCRHFVNHLTSQKLFLAVLKGARNRLLSKR
jgi:hypothetical protein